MTLVIKNILHSYPCKVAVADCNVGIHYAVDNVCTQMRITRDLLRLKFQLYSRLFSSATPVVNTLFYE